MSLNGKMFAKSLLLLLVCCGTSFGGDILYLATTDGHVLAIPGMTLGTHDRGSAGDKTIGDFFNGAAVYTTIEVGNDDDPFGRQVVAGDKDAVVRIFTADASDNPVTFAVSGPGNEVTGIAVGDFGALDNAIIVSHRIGTFGFPSNILTFNRTGLNAAPFTGQLNTLGGGTVTGLRLADIDPGKTGNELIASSINDVTLSLGTGQLSGISWNGGAQALDFQQAVPNMLTGVATGDMKPGVGGDEWLHTGGNFSGNDPTSVGEAWQSFSLVAGTPTFQNFNFQNVTPTNTTVDGEVADLLSGNAGLEFVGVGNDRINISSTGGDNVQLQQISTDDDMTGVTIADVLRNDGVPEIVVSTASGLVRAYEHLTPGDTSTLFGLAATLNLDPSGTGAYSIADITSAIPEPTTLVLLLVGGCGVFGATRRRRA